MDIDLQRGPGPLETLSRATEVAGFDIQTQRERIAATCLDVFFNDFDCHAIHRSGHSGISTLLISRPGEKRMPLRCEGKHEVHNAIFLKFPSLINALVVPFGTGVGPEDCAGEKAVINQADHMLGNGALVSGWVGNGTIALVEGQQIMDQVRVEFHGMYLLRVFSCSGRVAGMRFTAQRTG